MHHQTGPVQTVSQETSNGPPKTKCTRLVQRAQSRDGAVRTHLAPARCQPECISVAQKVNSRISIMRGEGLIRRKRRARNLRHRIRVRPLVIPFEPAIINTIIHGLARGLERIVQQVRARDVRIERKRVDPRIGPRMRECRAMVLAEGTVMGSRFEGELLQGLLLLRPGVEGCDGGKRGFVGGQHAWGDGFGEGWI